MEITIKILSLISLSAITYNWVVSGMRRHESERRKNIYKKIEKKRGNKFGF